MGTASSLGALYGGERNVVTVQTWYTYDSNMVYIRLKHGIHTTQTWYTYDSNMFHLGH